MTKFYLILERKLTIAKSVFLLLFMLILTTSCDDKNNDNKGNEYDPNQSVKLETFTPIEGGMATQVILKGSNLGNDPKAVKVYFNNKLAPVVGCNNGRILAITPRQPGDECIISVVIGTDSVTYSQKFTYHTRAVVTTIVGQKGSKDVKTGSFAEATFKNPSYLTIDDEGNLFLSDIDGDNKAHCVLMIDQQKRVVTQLLGPISGSDNKPNAPTTDITGKVILVPADGGSAKDKYYEFDAAAGWQQRIRQILHPTPEEVANGIPDFDINLFKHSFAICMLDSMIYLRSNRDGKLIKFNPKTRLGQWATNKNGEKLYLLQGTNGDGYLVFDPQNKERLYCALGGNSHRIGYCNVVTGETNTYAGKDAGWRDGKVDVAQFRNPRQMVLDIEGNLIVADNGNHCIRMISPTDSIVSTLVGIAGKAGYLDGNPDDALFENPWGLAVDRRDGAIYIADRGNQCIRKLTIE